MRNLFTKSSTKNYNIDSLVYEAFNELDDNFFNEIKNKVLTITFFKNSRLLDCMKREVNSIFYPNINGCLVDKNNPYFNNDYVGEREKKTLKINEENIVEIFNDINSKEIKEGDYNSFSNTQYNLIIEPEYIRKMYDIYVNMYEHTHNTNKLSFFIEDLKPIISDNQVDFFEKLSKEEKIMVNSYILGLFFNYTPFEYSSIIRSSEFFVTSVFKEQAKNHLKFTEQFDKETVKQDILFNNKLLIKRSLQKADSNNTNCIENLINFTKGDIDNEVSFAPVINDIFNELNITGKKRDGLLKKIFKNIPIIQEIENVENDKDLLVYFKTLKGLNKSLAYNNLKKTLDNNNNEFRRKMILNLFEVVLNEEERLEVKDIFEKDYPNFYNFRNYKSCYETNEKASKEIIIDIEEISKAININKNNYTIATTYSLIIKSIMEIMNIKFFEERVEKEKVFNRKNIKYLDKIVVTLVSDKSVINSIDDNFIKKLMDGIFKELKVNFLHPDEYVMKAREIYLKTIIEEKENSFVKKKKI